MKRYFLILLMTLIWSGTNIPEVFACSFGEPPPLTFDDFVERDVVFRGTIIENSRGNSIIRVERYLKGTGLQHILVFRQTPAYYELSAIRGYDFGCGGAVGAIGQDGYRAYFSMNQSASGTYSVDHIWSSLNYIPIQEGDDGQYITYEQAVENTDPLEYEEVKMSPVNFEAQIAEIVGNSGTVPPQNTYPRFRTLSVITESGQRYLLPIDRDELVLIEYYQACEENCPIISPDGSHYAYPIPEYEDTYAIWYPYRARQDNWYAGIDFGDYTVVPTRITAQELLFSPDGDYLLAWNDSVLTVYSFNVYEEYGNYGRLPRALPVWQTPLSVNDDITYELIAGQGAWSGNSNTIAYWDADGLHWLDLTTMVQSRLLIEFQDNRRYAVTGRSSTQVNSIPPLLELSRTGRYVRYGTAQEWSLYDTVSDLEFDDVLVSPDELTLLQVSPEEPISTTLRESITNTVSNCIEYDEENETCIVFTSPYIDYCNVPMGMCTDHVGVPEGYQLISTYWQRSDDILVFACEIAQPDICVTYPGQYRLRSYGTPEGLRTNAYAYDDNYGLFAMAIDDDSIRLTKLYSTDVIDFSDVLDSPIVSIEWDNPLWYLSD